ncbi:MAG: hypothetical protein PF568_01695 [Deltaproteobacteria bacterium]|jgi:hypothetical protein|nr:hypothetical protein [Deltaproteobacteria bacterium]
MEKIDFSLPLIMSKLFRADRGAEWWGLIRCLYPSSLRCLDMYSPLMAKEQKVYRFLGPWEEVMINNGFSGRKNAMWLFAMGVWSGRGPG